MLLVSQELKSLFYTAWSHSVSEAYENLITIHPCNVSVSVAGWELLHPTERHSLDTGAHINAVGFIE